MANPLNQLLAPFSEVDMASTYQQYGIIMDFLIYLVIFTGLSHFVFSKRFPHRGGKAISIGLALALSLGMSVFSKTTGFSLGNLGPLAGIILLILFGVMVFAFIKQLGGKSLNSGIIAFIAAYFLTRSAFPEIYQWTEQNQFAAWLDAAILISIPVLIITLIVKAKAKLSGKSIKELAISLNNPVFKKQVANDVSKLKNTEQLEKQSYKTEKKAVINEKKITKNIKSILTLLHTENLTEENRTIIIRILTDLKNRDNQLATILNQLKQFSQKISNWQIEEFQNLAATYKNLNSEEQKKLKQTIQAEHQSIINNREIESLEKTIIQNHSKFHNLLNQAIQQLNQNDKEKAEHFLRQALEIENQSNNLFQQLKKLQRQLIRLTQAEMGLTQNLAK